MHTFLIALAAVAGWSLISVAAAVLFGRSARLGEPPAWKTQRDTEIAHLEALYALPAYDRERSA